MSEAKRITKKEFYEAVITVTKEMLEDEHLEGMVKLVIPITGTLFADKMSKILFDENQEEK